MPELTQFQFNPVAVVHSCYKTKFGIPRQSGLIREATGEVELLPPYNQPNAVRGLEEFSHIWLLFVFDQNIREGWKATVRPPRLGGDKRIGVFASRSSFRPVPIGLSAVRLEGIVTGGHGKLCLKVSGLDLADGTPVLDIKPYLPYADIIPGATGGFAPDAPSETALQVTVSDMAREKLARYPAAFAELCRKVVAGDPRPAYQRIPGRVYQCYLENCEVLWQVGENPQEAIITDVLPCRRVSVTASPESHGKN